MKFALPSKMATLAGALLLAVAASAPGPLGMIAETEGGHVMGNPEADTQLIEFVSYTCGHCANFERQSEGALKLIFVGQNNLTMEIRHIVRDPIDLTAAMLAQCGPAEKFFQNHTAFMLSQSTWLPKAQKASAAQQQRWMAGDFAARRRAIASDLDFYELMERRGYSRLDADKCLNDNAAAQALVNTSYENSETYGVTGTPSFALNGKLLDGVHSWDSLSKVLQETVKQAAMDAQ